MENFDKAATAEFTTILDFLRYGITCATANDLYYGHGTDNVYDDIRALILDSLNLPHDIDDQMLLARLTPHENTLLTQHLYRRIAEQVPVPYLTHKAHFCDLTFYVDERVLIPRSPIAELIQQHFTPWIEPEKVTRILDLCTGSGCIAIACAYHFPDADVDAVDISPKALEVAAINCAKHQCDDTVRLVHSDCFANLTGERYDIIVTNPPYVGAKEMATLPKEYKHEPDLALRAEQNGLAIVANILREAAAHLTVNGILVVEVGNSDLAVAEAWPEVPFTWLEFEHGGHGVFVLTREQLLACGFS